MCYKLHAQRSPYIIMILCRCTARTNEHTLLRLLPNDNEYRAKSCESCPIVRMCKTSRHDARSAMRTTRQIPRILCKSACPASVSAAAHRCKYKYLLDRGSHPIRNVFSTSFRLHADDDDKT